MNNKLSGTLLLFPEAGFRARDSLLSSSVCLRLAGWLKHCNFYLSLYVIRLAGWLKHCSLSLSSSGSAVQNNLKRDGEGSCVSRGSGTTPEYAMHSESVSVQHRYRTRLAEL